MQSTIFAWGLYVFCVRLHYKILWYCVYDAWYQAGEETDLTNGEASKKVLQTSATRLDFFEQLL